MQPHRPPPSFLFFMTITIFISILASKPVHTAYEQFVNCDKILKCANLQSIGYPFWGGNRPEYCGHPGFKLDCQGEAPQITIRSQTYRIFGIDYSTETLRVARQDFWNNACPVYLCNTTMESTLFRYVSDTRNLTLYYGCSEIPFLPRGAAQFNCSTNGTNSLNFYEAVNGLFNNSIGCLASVTVPVFQSAAQALEGDSSSSSLEAALDGGFGLQWSANNELCHQCFASGGRCGHELSSSVFTCFCSDKAYASSCSTTQNESGSNKGFPLGWRIAIGFAISVPGTIIIVIIIIQYHKGRCIVSVKATTFWRKESQDDKNIESLIRQYGSLALKRYSYSDVEKMTNSFRDKLGQGGYGSVYKGKLSTGHLIAVKVLKETKGNGEEFINEVASISKTAHVNIVTLLGFCYERNRRALIYEFMPNGSLDKFIHKDGAPNTNCKLEWKTMYQIVVGIARGLEYLHRGCRTRIVHFDIKPQNILLDENFCPKISDFGLAKLCQLEESVISMLGARGTIGYIASEVFSRTFGGVSHKSDVYSYGMMILEMAGERKNVENSIQSSDCYFPHRIYENI